MKRRIVSIICIMFLLFAITSPISGSIFSYADEPQQEQLSQDEVIKAAIALYLNERKAWITSTTSAPIDAVQAQMQTWIDSYEFWTEHTTIGSAAAFYAQCIVKYNPFRISLKGPAVRALNDLYNWLIDSGKLPNLDADNSGGETTDNLYNGLLNGDSLYYIVDKNTYQSNTAAQYFSVSSSNIVPGSPARGVTWQSIKSGFDAANNNNVDYTANSNPGYSNYSFSVRWAADKVRSYNVSFSYVGSGLTAVRPYSPKIGCSVSGTDIDNIYEQYFLAGSIYINNGTNKVYGNPAFIQIKNNSGVITTYIGIVSYNATSNNYIVQTYEKFGSETSTPANVNLDTDNFNKTDPTPPEGDDEVTYTPSDKTTGDTYNTYNEYITNYVTKNTVVNNNNSGGGGSDPSPGGTTPPWDGGDTTVTPDGDGFNLNLPDLTLPDLNIDWSINGLSEKFPFSIPWDLMAFFTVLNAEPETPAIEAQIDLGIVDWDIDWDLHNFDTLAALLRNLEFIGFCLALILITRSIIKG